MEKTYRKSLLILIFICVVITSLNPLPSPLYAQGGSVTGSMGNLDDAYLEFTLTGADLKLREGTTNHYEGPWTGGPITLSGKMIVTRKSDPITGGGVSYVRFYGYLVDQRNMFKWPQDENYVLVQNRTETQEASITYTVPDGYNQPTVEGKIEVEVCGQTCGKLEFFFHISILPQEETPLPTQTNTHAPSSTPDNCVWKLKQRMPQTTTSPAYDDVMIQAQAPSFLISAEGLYITQTWKPFPDILVPRGKYAFEFVNEWATDRSLTFDEKCDIKTSLAIVDIKSFETGRSNIDLNLEPNGYLVEPFAYQLPTGKTGQDLWFTISVDTCLGRGTATYTYTYTCPIDQKPFVPTQKIICGGDSGARFVEFDGEVLVSPSCFNEWDDAFYEDPAERDMVLKCGDKITTGGYSSAIVGFSDMSFFNMKPRSSVILDTCQEKESKLSLLYGNIKANLKQMIEKGTLDVTMNQAVTGTKATIFVAEDTGETSTLKVIEGEMWFQSLATGETVDVLAGQMVSADVSGLSPITNFDIEAELATWPDDQNIDWSNFPTTSQGSWLKNLLPDFLKNPPTALVIVLLILGFFGLGLFMIIFVMRIAKKKKIPESLEAQNSSSALPVVLMIGLIIFSCLMLTGGGIGLFLNLRQPPAVTQVSEIDQTLTALAQTQSFLAQQQTINSQNQFVPDTPEPTLPQEPSLTPAPTNTVAALIEVPPTATNQPVNTDPPLTGGQFIRENAFFDDFTSNAMGWPVKDDGLTYLDIVNQAYFFQVSEKSGFEHAYFPIDFFPDEIIFDVWGPENATEGTFGVICQLQDANNYYYVDFDLAGGNYSIAQVLNGELVTLTTENNNDQYWHSTDAFNQPATSKNHINVSCYLGDIAIVVNETLIDLVFIDQPFTQPGKAAFFVFTYDYLSDSGFQVIIDNVEAYRPVQ